MVLLMLLLIKLFLKNLFRIMINGDNKSVMISISKKRTLSGKTLVVPLNKKLVTSKLSDLKLKKFILPNEESLPIRKLKRPENLLPFKQYSKRQDSDRFKRRLAISIYEKYMIISIDLKKRLQVDNPLNDVYSVTDVDEDYYRYLGGRPLCLHVPRFKSFKVSINKILELKQETGIKKDCFLNIETNYRNELAIYDTSVKKLTDQAKYFDAFISEDYKKSMDILAKWDKLKLQVDVEIKELQNLAIEKFTIKSRLIGLEYQYGLQQKYGRFLYYLSPPTWRLNNREFARSVEIEAKGFDFGNSNEEDTFAIIFEKLKSICYGTAIKPVLYFSQPKDLMDVFNAMESQQLHYYTHVNHLAPHAKVLKEGIKSLKDNIFQDYAVVANSIKVYETLLKFCEDRCIQLEKKFLKILLGLFYNSVGSPDVLKLISHLEFCYEKVFLEKPINVDYTVIAKSIEKLYMDYSKRLDANQSNTVRRAMSKCIEIERLKAKKAKHAAKELRLFYRLQSELLRAYGIDAENLYTPIKREPDKKIMEQHSMSPKFKTKQNIRKTLTETELEYLSLFTDWTENEDPANYLQILTSNNNEHKDVN